MWPDFPFTPTPQPAAPTPPDIIGELNADAETIDKFRTELLFERDNFTDADFTPKTAQHFLCAINYLDLANRALKLAALEMNP